MGTQKTVQEAIAPATADVEKLVIDPVHSSIGFSVRHMAISNVQGRFTRFAGIILYDRLDIARSSVGITIETASINTENSDRDNDLRSTNFFDCGEISPDCFPK